MPKLTNIRHAQGSEGVEVWADFTVPDGRWGSVSVPLALFEAHGEMILQQEAEACAQQARSHGYRPPQDDRYNELR